MYFATTASRGSVSIGGVGKREINELGKSQSRRSQSLKSPMRQETNNPLDVFSSLSASGLMRQARRHTLLGISHAQTLEPPNVRRRFRFHRELRLSIGLGGLQLKTTAQPIPSCVFSFSLIRHFPPPSTTSPHNEPENASRVCELASRNHQRNMLDVAHLPASKPPAR